MYEYDPVSGSLTPNKSWHMPPTNGRGKPCTANDPRDINGYLTVTICGKTYYAHRVAWKMFHRREPNELDHVNGNKADMRIENLREVTHAENMLNRRQQNSLTGVRGVYITAGGKYRAAVGRNNKVIHLGTFARAEDASAAVEEFRRKRFAELREQAASTTKDAA